MLQNSVFAAALVCAFAAVPSNQALAQYATPQTLESTDNQTVPDKAADAWITTKVKSELAAAKGVKASDIDVDTSDSMVKLSGMVSSSREKTRAVNLAKAVKGVKSVDASSLRVSGMDTDHPMPKTDHPMSDMPARSASAGH
jgi:hyperosmotically inducible protein